MGKGALSGLKVLEFATMVSGPYCGKLLADLGADVIKVEPPGGDPARGAGPFPKSGPNPEQSGLFLYNNTSKRGITLDLENPAAMDLFRLLLKWADVFIDDHPPTRMEKLGLTWEEVHRFNPALVYVSITPYGRTGPRASAKGDELTLIHAGGLGNLLPARSVDVDRAPVKLGGYPVGYHGGIFAAFAVVSAVVGRARTGLGMLIDLSLQEVILNLVSPLVASTRYHDTTWCRVPDRPPAMGRMETSDGYVVLGAVDDHHFRILREIMGNPEWAAGDQWDDMGWRTHHLMDIAPMMEAWMREQKKEDIHHKAAKKGVPVGPMATAKDVLENPQYAARGYFVEVEHPEAGKHRYAGWPYRMSASPPRVTRPAPLLGEHNEEIVCEVLGLSPVEWERHQEKGAFGRLVQDRIGPVRSPLQKERAGARAATFLVKENPPPLQGIRVLDFSWVWAGPYACMLLGNLGAEVIKVESHKRRDLMRRTVVWPLADPAPHRAPPNQGLSFNAVNMNKRSVTIDLGRPEGVELAKKLVAVSDIVLDNMRPDVMRNLGLGYEDLRRIREDIIVISSSSRGHEGPDSRYLGFATIHHAIGGGSYITGYPDDHPSHGSPGDVDILNATTCAFAAVAAFYHRLQTGEGQFIDYSQCEGVSSIIGEALLGYEMTSEIPERMGNAHPRYAPHNVYRCWGVDRWLALEIHSDEEFLTVAGIMNKAELASDPRFADMASRKKNEHELDQIIGAWIRERDRDWMVKEFSQAGLRAAPSRDARDVYADAHLRSRESIITVQHPELGDVEMLGPPWRMSGCETVKARAPLLGEHNRYVFGQLLGLRDKDLADLELKGVIGPDIGCD